MVMRIADNEIFRRIQQHAERNIEPRSAANTVCAARASSETRQSRNFAAWSDLANSVTKRISHVNVARGIQYNATRVIKACGAAGAVHGSGCSSQPRQCANQTYRTNLANRVIKAIGDISKARAVHLYARRIIKTGGVARPIGAPRTPCQTDPSADHIARSDLTDSVITAIGGIDNS